jgi:hypothetical protein
MNRSRAAAALSAAEEVRGLVVALHRFRTRARLVVFVEELWTAIAIGAAAVVVWNLAWASTGQQRRTALAVAVVGTLVAAAGRSYRRAPTLSTTGNAIDRSLHLQNRIVAALQVAQEQDAMSALIVRDATARLGRATPADVFPLTLGRRAIVGTLLVTFAVLIATVDISRATSSRQPGVGAIARPGFERASAGANSPTGVPAETALPDVRAGESANARPTGPPEGILAPPGAGAITEGRPSPPGASAPSPAAAPPVQSDADAQSPIPRPGMPSSSQAPAGRGGQGARSGAGSAGAAPAQAVLGTMPAGAGGSVSDSRRPRGGEAGGVAAGNLGAVALSSALGSSGLAGSSVRDPGVARAPADTSLSSDEIPPARRQYVRDYFLRLRSPGGPR